MWPFLGLLAAAPSAFALQELWYNITYVENVNPDGRFARRVIGVNNTWPPPTQNLNGNEDYAVHVTNSLDVPYTNHQHGMYFNSSGWYDGVSQVTQCGIPPGGQFDYYVALNQTPQYGTYWYHSHYKAQYVDGIRGPTILHNQPEAYTYDEEYTVVISDWYHAQATPLLNEFLSRSDASGAEPVPDSGLIYFGQNGSYLGPAPGTSPGGGTNVGFNENATLPFEPGKTYRLRIVNVGGFATQYFWIEGHEMRVIEVDGTDVEEYPLSQLSVTVAQRYSVLVTALNDTSANYAMHANMDTTMFDSLPASLIANTTASVMYNASAPLINAVTTDAYLVTHDIDIVPLQAVGIIPATDTIALEFEFDTMSDGTNHAVWNGTTYNSPLVPALMSALTLGDNATTQAAYGPLSFVVDHLAVYDLLIMNGDDTAHPFHLHGHKFQIVNRALDYTSDDPTLNPPINESQVNPIRRDTVQIPAGGSVTLRAIADNPGVWFFHCHIEWHLESGLALQIVEAPLVAQERNAMPADVMDAQCSALGLPYTGNAAGHASATDLSGLPLGPYLQNNGWHSRGMGAMAGCVLTATIGMISVVWYALGGHGSQAQMEEAARIRQEKKAAGRGGFFGLASAAQRVLRTKHE